MAYPLLRIAATARAGFERWNTYLGDLAGLYGHDFGLLPLADQELWCTLAGNVIDRLVPEHNATAAAALATAARIEIHRHYTTGYGGLSDFELRPCATLVWTDVIETMAGYARLAFNVDPRLTQARHDKLAVEIDTQLADELDQVPLSEPYEVLLVLDALTQYLPDFTYIDRSDDNGVYFLVGCYDTAAGIYHLRGDRLIPPPAQATGRRASIAAIVDAAARAYEALAPAGVHPATTSPRSASPTADAWTQPLGER